MKFEKCVDKTTKGTIIKVQGDQPITTVPQKDQLEVNRSVWTTGGYFFFISLFKNGCYNISKSVITADLI